MFPIPIVHRCRRVAVDGSDELRMCEEKGFQRVGDSRTLKELRTESVTEGREQDKVLRRGRTIYVYLGSLSSLSSLSRCLAGQPGQRARWGAGLPSFFLVYSTEWDSPSRR